MHKNLLLIFTRNPELGKVKTRLAKTVGPKTALEIYTFLLEKTRLEASTVNADKAVYYSVKIRENDCWDATIFEKHQQKGNDLGERMQNAFEKGFKDGYKNIIIIGSDLYDLSSKAIDAAFSDLDTQDAVIGPAEDGGYYLLGLKKLHTSVFRDKEWGTSSVEKETLNNLKAYHVKRLEIKNDIDVYEDITSIPEIMNRFILDKN